MDSKLICFKLENRNFVGFIPIDCELPLKKIRRQNPRLAWGRYKEVVYDIPATDIVQNHPKYIGKIMRKMENADHYEYHEANMFDLNLTEEKAAKKRGGGNGK